MYHMTKAHWNSIDLRADVSDDEIKQFIDHSYQLVVESLPLKARLIVSGHG